MVCHKMENQILDMIFPPPQLRYGFEGASIALGTDIVFVRQTDVEWSSCGRRESERGE